MANLVVHVNATKACTLTILLPKFVHIFLTVPEKLLPSTINATNITAYTYKIKLFTLTLKIFQRTKSEQIIFFTIENRKNKKVILLSEKKIAQLLFENSLFIKIVNAFFIANIKVYLINHCNIHI